MWSCIQTNRKHGTSLSTSSVPLTGLRVQTWCGSVYAVVRTPNQNGYEFNVYIFWRALLDQDLWWFVETNLNSLPKSGVQLQNIYKLSSKILSKVLARFFWFICLFVWISKILRNVNPEILLMLYHPNFGWGGQMRKLRGKYCMGEFVKTHLVVPPGDMLYWISAKDLPSVLMSKVVPFLLH